MYRLFSAVFLHGIALLLLGTLIAQLVWCPHVGSGVFWWPVLIAALSTAAAFLWPQSERVPDALHPFPPPSSWWLRLLAVCNLGLSPFWNWTFAPVNFSHPVWWYLSLMVALALAVGLSLLVAFSCHLREVCRRSSRSFLRSIGEYQASVWLYTVAVPALTVFCCLFTLCLKGGRRDFYGLFMQTTTVLLSTSIFSNLWAVVVLANLLGGVAISIACLCEFSHNNTTQGEES